MKERLPPTHRKTWMLLCASALLVMPRQSHAQDLDGRALVAPYDSSGETVPGEGQAPRDDLASGAARSAEEDAAEDGGTEDGDAESGIPDDVPPDPPHEVIEGSAETTLPDTGREQETGSTARVTAVALTGLAFLGAGVGASYTIQSVSQGRQAEAECTPACSAEGDRLERGARRARALGQIGFAVGLVSLGGAVYLWLTESGGTDAAREATRPLRWDVAAVPGGASASLGGRF